MKPCSNNRKLIAWLAVDALPASQAGELRAHIQDCPGCRRYLDEISSVAKSLSTPELPPDIQASASFHGRIVRALVAEAARSPWQRLAAWFGVANGPRAVLGSQRPPTRKDAQIFSTLPPQSDALRAEDGSRSVPLGRFWAWLIIRHPYWRLALPVVIGVVLVGVALSLHQRPASEPLAQPIARAGPAPIRTGDLPPTLSNYQIAADRSPEALDELLVA